MAQVEEEVASDHSSDSHKEEEDERGYEEAEIYMPGFNSSGKKTKTITERPKSPSFRLDKARSF